MLAHAIPKADLLRRLRNRPQSPSPHPPLNTRSACWGEKIEVTDEHASVSMLRPSDVRLSPPKYRSGGTKARVGSLGSANKGVAPELAGFMARVRSTLRELTVAHCLTTANEVSGGSLGDGP